MKRIVTKEVEKIKAVFVEAAICNGSGSDHYKWITGLTKSVLAQIKLLEKKHGDLQILASSHTGYNGQDYKLAKQWSRGWNHRQINDENYDIVEVI